MVIRQQQNERKPIILNYLISYQYIHTSMKIHPLANISYIVALYITLLLYYINHVVVLIYLKKMKRKIIKKIQKKEVKFNKNQLNNKKKYKLKDNFCSLYFARMCSRCFLASGAHVRAVRLRRRLRTARSLQ